MSFLALEFLERFGEKLYIIFVYVSSFVLKDVGARESAEVFGNQLFMLLVPVYAFYFGGRSFEKILKNRK